MHLIKLFFDFKGRINKKDFFFTILFYYSILSILVFLDLQKDNEVIDSLKPFLSIMILSFRIRRLHDFGISGWWILLGLPVALILKSPGILVVDVLLLLLKENKVENKYGRPISTSYWVSMWRLIRPF